MLLVSLLPSGWDLDVDFAEDTHHFAAYLALGLTSGATYTRSRLQWAVTLGFVAGAFELLQYLSPGREPSWEDFLSGVVGAFVGIGFAWACRSLITRRAANSGGNRPR